MALKKSKSLSDVFVKAFMLLLDSLTPVQLRDMERIVSGFRKDKKKSETKRLYEDLRNSLEKGDSVETVLQGNFRVIRVYKSRPEIIGSKRGETEEHKILLKDIIRARRNRTSLFDIPIEKRKRGLIDG